MKFSIREAETYQDYLESWKKAMRDTPWFKERKLFYYHPNGMAKELEQDFKKTGNIHLVANPKQDHVTLGILGVSIEGGTGTLGRWEPAVPLRFRTAGVAEALLEEAFKRLRESRVSKVKSMLKFPFSQPQTARWLTRLYRKCGFAMNSSSRGIMLMLDLSRAEGSASHLSAADSKTIAANSLPIEEYVLFTQKAYLTTPEDKRVHKNDPIISNNECLVEVLRAIRQGKMGYSPSEFWLLAKHKDAVAGFILGFMPTSFKHRPRHGVIGELGVFPEYRRKGMAAKLIRELLKALSKSKCKYCLVSTLKSNKPAIALYKKLGFSPIFELVDFEKSLA